MVVLPEYMPVFLFRQSLRDCSLAACLSAREENVKLIQEEVAAIWHGGSAGGLEQANGCNGPGGLPAAPFTDRAVRVVFVSDLWAVFGENFEKWTLAPKLETGRCLFISTAWMEDGFAPAVLSVAFPGYSACSRSFGALRNCKICSSAHVIPLHVHCERLK